MATLLRSLAPVRLTLRASSPTRGKLPYNWSQQGRAVGGIPTARVFLPAGASPTPDKAEGSRKGKATGRSLAKRGGAGDGAGTPLIGLGAPATSCWGASSRGPTSTRAMPGDVLGARRSRWVTPALGRRDE